ncbi:MAG: hypothetical protein M1829_003350 [Trizodia sp. TS-e1964]|nr:MAG: hypothetical protein M1829_003350 [Trizodia sp. TS-e1964]
MAASRPSVFNDNRSRSHDPSHSGRPSPDSLQWTLELPSPRVAHLDGDIPPALSPLDAFAAQGRLLAKQLDDSAKDGKRMSRLPPLAIATSLAQPRPGCFRSLSATPTSPASGERSRPNDESVRKVSPAVEVSHERHISQHPRLSGIQLPDSKRSTLEPLETVHERGRNLFSARQANPFTITTSQRHASPESLQLERHPLEAELPLSAPLPRESKVPETFSRNIYVRREASSASRSYDPNALAPPLSPHMHHNGSARSLNLDTDDDDSFVATGPYYPSPQRKLSSSSGLSGPRSPMSQFIPGPPRSPSVSSEYSIGGSVQARPAFNFSRPMSRASRPSLDVPSRQASSDSQPYFSADDAIHTPISMNSEELPDSPDANLPAPSYIYSKFTLPRGKVLQRNSIVFQPDLIQHRFQWESPPISSANMAPVAKILDATQSSPATPPRPQTALDEPGSWSPHLVPSVPLPRSSTLRPKASSPLPSKGHKHSSSVSNDRPLAKPAFDTGSDISAEEHVTKAIKCHEEGSLNESTYHLRIAAKANHPTGMLLYALACRHGWGMRPNQREGVEWLRKAASTASLEVSDESDLANASESKTRRAQFALSIYELGVSHMNGWGIEQDKTLALRCFEIAGAWGDSDALAETGFCYAKGVGCKKDLKKSAHFYRMAESKGMSMVGNSWIYKSKYMDDEDRRSRSAKKTTPEKKSRDKSRTRSIFSRKRLLPVPPP